MEELLMCVEPTQDRSWHQLTAALQSKVSFAHKYSLAFLSFRLRHQLIKALFTRSDGHHRFPYV
jgi:hypothetical protein